MADNSSPRKLFVGNLPEDVSVEKLAFVFSHYGRVQSVRIMTNTSTYDNACAFVEMGTSTEADLAIQTLHGKYEPDFGYMMVTKAGNEQHSDAYDRQSHVGHRWQQSCPGLPYTLRWKVYWHHDTRSWRRRPRRDSGYNHHEYKYNGYKYDGRWDVGYKYNDYNRYKHWYNQCKYDGYYYSDVCSPGDADKKKLSPDERMRKLRMEVHDNTVRLWEREKSRKTRLSSTRQS